MTLKVYKSTHEHLLQKIHKMDKHISNQKLYEIPPNSIGDKRRKFYGLTPKSSMAVGKWFEHVFNHFDECDFSKGLEYILTDRFVCELSTEERNDISEEDLNWSIKCVFLGKTVVSDDHHDSNESESVDEARDLIFYEVQSNEVLNNRRKFYGLKKKNIETIENWFERVFSHASNCNFPESVEYVLPDKFVCELSDEERNNMRKADSNWSIKCEIGNETIATDDEDHSLTDSSNITTMHVDLVSVNDDDDCLEQHEHTADERIRSHLCEQYGKRVSSSKALKFHLLAHTGRRPYSCDQCNMSFSQPGTLANHKKFVHQHVRLFVCDVCGSRSTTEQNLRKHYLIHTGVHQQIRPYGCWKCDERFTSAHSVESHFITHIVKKG